MSFDTLHCLHEHPDLILLGGFTEMVGHNLTCERWEEWGLCDHPQSSFKEVLYMSLYHAVCLANCGLSLSCRIQISTLNIVNSPPAALVPTTFDSKYIIHESFIDDLWTQRSDIVHICKDNDNVREDRKLNTSCSALREGYVASYLCQ